MRKWYLVLLVSALSLVQFGLCNEQEDLLALTTNFGPKRMASSNQPPETVVTPPPAAPRPVAPPPPVVKPVAPAPAAETRTPANTNFRPAPRPTPPPEPEFVPRPPAPETPVGRTAKEEAVRRQESQIVGQQLIGEGLKLYYDGKHDAAIPKFEQALKVLPRADATQVDYDRAVRGLSDCYERLADAALRSGDKGKAKQFANKSLEYEPGNRAAENIIVKLKLDEQDAAAKVERAAIEAKKPKAIVERPNLDRTPEFQARQDELRKLFREGRILMNSGQYDQAETRYKQILLIDHYNQDAYRGLQDIHALRNEITYEGVDATRRQRLWQVTEAWVPSVGGEVKMPEKPKETVVTATSGEKEKIERKLRNIKFPEVSFRDAVIADVVDFLHKESIRVDPDDPKEGVNIVLGAGVSGGAAPAPAPAPDAAAVPGAPPLPVAAPVPGAPPAAAGGAKLITLSLRNVPMIEALKYITSLAGLKYRVESSAVVLLPVDAVDVTEMTTRSYNVSPDSIRALITGAAGGMAPPAPQLGGGGAIPAAPVVPGAVPAGGGAGAGGSEELKTFFVNAGVPFPPGSSLQYFERARTIYVRNTPENLEIFEKVLATFNVVPSQVEIESKFIEITQTDLDELGFQFGLGTMQIGTRNPNPHTTVQGMMGAGLPMGQQGYSPATNLLPGAVGWISQGLRGAGIFKGNAVDSLLVGATKATTLQDALASFQGVLNGASAQMIINALSQKKSADVLSAPKVTTISGAQAQIRVVQEFIYPSEYSQPAVADGALPTPSIPTAFKTREVGVILNVTPTVGADGYTINLTLVPEVSAFLGMLDYSPDPIVAIQSNFNAAIMVPYKIWQPLFETRNLTTSIVIWDGQTVVLGGLIREEVSKIDDKVPFLGDIPFLGRLFRSKSNSRIKRNLLVFVTARLIDPAGNLIHRPDTPGFRFDPNGNVIRGPEPALSTRP